MHLIKYNEDAEGWLLWEVVIRDELVLKQQPTDNSTQSDSTRCMYLTKWIPTNILSQVSLAVRLSGPSSWQILIYNTVINLSRSRTCRRISWPWHSTWDMTWCFHFIDHELCALTYWVETSNLSVLLVVFLCDSQNCDCSSYYFTLSDSHP